MAGLLTEQDKKIMQMLQAQKLGANEQPIGYVDPSQYYNAQGKQISPNSVFDPKTGSYLGEVSPVSAAEEYKYATGNGYNGSYADFLKNQMGQQPTPNPLEAIMDQRVMNSMKQTIDPTKVQMPQINSIDELLRYLGYR